MKKQTKYNYYKVIQQNFGFGHGWEDVSHYECNSVGICSEKTEITNKYGRKQLVSLCSQDYKEYCFMGYATRIIKRKELKTV